MGETQCIINRSECKNQLDFDLWSDRDAVATEGEITFK